MSASFASNYGSGSRGKLLPATTFRAVNDHTLSQLALDLYMAVLSGYSEDVRNILISHPDVDVNISVKGATVLSLSLYKRHFHIFSLLMKHHERGRKFDLNKSSEDNLKRIEPPIITASRMHFFEGVVSLVNAGADIDVTDNLGRTAIWFACRHQMQDLVEYLILKGASVNKPDHYHNTPLITAFLYRVSSIIIKTLILHGSILDGPSCKYQVHTQHSPLFWALKYSNIEITKLILHAGIPVSDIRCVKRTYATSNEVDSTLLQYLEEKSKSPMNLKQMCRMEVRRYFSIQFLGKNFVQNINALPLPPILKQYLLLK
ncbi:hypothetical protein CHS0354_005947 [Potamilus streckersoni]|uniref:SOCS box domain-containing protein n=1 Tax=Potamilus streckersoni TaxID=2493646 RepID=A0AAE0SNA3_9BIVA|nr:hypothetical protein CHS0354_005947 [Potamilus streckersoni]